MYSCMTDYIAPKHLKQLSTKTDDFEKKTWW